MPYSDDSELPEYVKKFSRKIRSMWRQVFNKTYNKILKDGGSVKSAEAKAFRMANGIVNKNMEKFGAGRYGHRNNILYLIDKFIQKP